MPFLEKLCALAGKYAALIFACVWACALFAPETCLWLKTSWISTMLAIVMLAMGLTLRTDDFVNLVRHPKGVFIGLVAQYTIMPLLAVGLGYAFGLEGALLAGVVLVGTCPGGTASNVMTYLAKGDVALSVGMTCASTLLAPVVTPMLTWLILNQSLHVDVVAMMWSITKVVLIPISLGILANQFFQKAVSQAAKTLPLVSVAAISAIIASVTAANAERILTCAPVVVGVVALHNCLGYALGLLAGKALRMPAPAQKTLSIEVGMQNSGLAVSLAIASFPGMPLASIPGAIFSVWHDVSGAIYAAFLRKRP